MVRRLDNRAFICAVTVVLCSSFLFAAEQSGTNRVGVGAELVRYRVFSLRHISAAQGRMYLAEARMGTVSQLPSANMLLVAAGPAELIKISALLKLVDADELFCIKAIFPASEAKNLPSNEAIAAEVGDISIGTFSEPPSRAAKTRAIMDVHKDVVIAVAPAEQLERIIAIIEQLQARALSPVPSEPNELQAASHESRDMNEAELTELAGSADAEDFGEDELFGKLLDSLAEAEGSHFANKSQNGNPSEPQHIGAEPNEPNTVVIVPEPNEPRPSQRGEGEPNTAPIIPEPNEPNAPSADFEQIEESAPAAAEQPQEPNLPAVVEAPEAKEVAEKPEAEPDLELAEERVEVEPQRPSEVNEVAEPALKVQPYEPEPIANGEEMLELDLPEKLNIVDLLGLVGEYLHLDYMYDSAKVKGDVALRLRGPIKVRDLYPLLESVLKFKGFVMTRRGNLVTVVPAGEALEIDPALQPEGDKIERGDVIITRVFGLKYIDTASAKNLLSGMKLGADIKPIAETGTLIVTGYAYRMARIEELLQMVDKPGEPRQFRFRQLKYTMAKTLAPKIKTLAGQLGTVSISITAAPVRVARKSGESASAFRARQAKAAAAAKPVVGAPTVYLDADERTNRILMVGLEEQLAVVDELIDSLDVQQQDLRTLRLYEIQKVGAEEVVKKLKELGIIGAGRAAAPARPSPSRK